MVRLVRAEFNTAVKYLTSVGFVNTFPITFKYDKPEYLVVQVGFKEIEPTEYLVVEGTGVTDVEFNEDLPEGVYVTLRSRSDASGVPHTYHYTGNVKGQSEFNQKTMDENFNYLSRIVEEVNDSAELTQDSLAGFEDNFNEVSEEAALALRIANSADTKATAALVNSNTALDTSADALAKAEGAIITADTALNTATEASTTATAADTKADAALTASSNAEISASIALTLATQANDTSSTALGTAEDAKLTAEGIEAKADQAVDTANEASGTANEAWETATGIAGVANDALETATKANEKAQEALDKATEGGITETELIEKSLGNGKWIRESKLKEEIDAIPKPDMSEYRKLDNTDFDVRVSVFSEDRSNYVQLVADQSSNAYLASWGWGVGKVWHALPLESGTLALKSQVDTKWEVQTTVGTGDIARMSEVTKKADTSYVNTELGKKRDKGDGIFENVRLVTTEGDSRIALAISEAGRYILTEKGSTQWWLQIPESGGTIATTSDLNGYATQSWVNSKGYTTLGTANANSTKLGAEQFLEWTGASNADDSVRLEFLMRDVPPNSVVCRYYGSGKGQARVTRVYYRPVTRS